jgi:hypothetical protein
MNRANPDRANTLAPRPLITALPAPNANETYHPPIPSAT